MTGKLRLFISSVQKEFAAERRALRDFVDGDALLRRFFSVFLFEDLPASDRHAGISSGILDFFISVADNTGVAKVTDTCSPLDTLVLTTGLGRGYFLSWCNFHAD
ncbi:MAG: hypothetical protein A3G34_01890 [Candidatus Lindowbacteria bacterium RIFCSPLOWO2_12_FULL_62_27]|nr:MAG: hypothetical protein A3G34_01890 [Candidatus Lindowbacteria bacterium RIFCSPLOWO2_12_FULL_62_27]